MKVTKLENNLFCAATQAAYREFSTDIGVPGFAEEAQQVENAAGNVEQKITVAAPGAWAAAYASRVVVDRQKAEADVEAKKGWQNDVRSMLGLPLQGTDLKLDTPVWLHRIDTDGALNCGMTAFDGKFGCSSLGQATPAQPSK